MYAILLLLLALIAVVVLVGGAWCVIRWWAFREWIRIEDQARREAQFEKAETLIAQMTADMKARSAELVERTAQLKASALASEEFMRHLRSSGL